MKKDRQRNGEKDDLQNITHKTKDRVIRTQLNTGGELGYSGRVGSSCSTSDTRCVNLVTNPVLSHEWGNDWEEFTTSGTYPGHLWHRYSIRVNQVMVATVKLSKWWIQLNQEEPVSLYLYWAKSDTKMYWNLEFQITILYCILLEVCLEINIYHIMDQMIHVFPRDESKYYNQQSNGLLLKEHTYTWVTYLYTSKGRTTLLYHLDRMSKKTVIWRLLILPFYCALSAFVIIYHSLFM